MQAETISPVNTWLVVDYHEDFIIVRAGQAWPDEDGELSEFSQVVTYDFIVPTTGEDQSYGFWDAYNEDWQTGVCPFLDDEDWKTD